MPINSNDEINEENYKILAFSKSILLSILTFLGIIIGDNLIVNSTLNVSMLGERVKLYPYLQWLC